MTAPEATLLVVEDDVHLLQGIRDILEIEGYHVVTASNGVEGLELLRSLPTVPDLIISDIMMPVMDGYAFFEEVRAAEAWMEIPFVFLTARGEKHDVRFGKHLGADDYVVKPMDPEDLLVIVGAKLKRHAQIKERYDGRISDVKRSILTILNHEFRTPLTYMVAYSDMLNNEPQSLTADELRTFLRGVNSGTDRFRRLVENFIALVELETGEAASSFKWRSQPMSDVRALFTDVVEAARPFAEEQHVTLAVDIPDDLPQFVADYEYLRLALSQLVENAIKFSDEKPDARVVLRAAAEPDSIRLSVQDWGRGIEPAELDRIWEPFYQIDRELYEDQGAGSGLAIVRGIVEDLHGGKAEVHSTFGEGSTFSILLRRLPSDA